MACTISDDVRCSSRRTEQCFFNTWLQNVSGKVEFCYNALPVSSVKNCGFAMLEAGLILYAKPRFLSYFLLIFCLDWCERTLLVIALWYFISKLPLYCEKYSCIFLPHLGLDIPDWNKVTSVFAEFFVKFLCCRTPGVNVVDFACVGSFIMLACNKKINTWDPGISS